MAAPEEVTATNAERLSFLDGKNVFPVFSCLALARV